MSVPQRRKLVAEPLSGRAYAAPKKYQKTPWLRNYWRAVMDDFRQLGACPFKAVERNGVLSLYILRVQKIVFRKDGSTAVFSRTVWRPQEQVGRQLSLFPDETLEERKSLWREDTDDIEYLIGMHRNEQYAERWARDEIMAAIRMMKEDPAFVMHRFCGCDTNEIEAVHDSSEYILPGYSNTDHSHSAYAHADLDMCSSDMVKYLIRAAHAFFPKFYRLFSDYFDYELLDILCDAGWLGSYKEYQVYAAHSREVRRIADERPNLLPLLDLIRPEFWGRDDIFAARHWVRQKNPFLNEDVVCRRMRELCLKVGMQLNPARWRARTPKRWPPWQKDISRATWRKIVTTPALSLKAMLLSGLGTLYDFNAFFELLRTGRKFPWELLPFALQMISNEYAEKIFIMNGDVNYTEDTDRTDLKRNVSNELIRMAILRIGQLWLGFKTDNLHAITRLTYKSKLGRIFEHDDALAYASDHPEQILDHNMKWKTIKRITQFYAIEVQLPENMRIFHNNTPVQDSYVFAITEDKKDLWWSTLDKDTYAIGNYRMEELCTSNDMYSESLQQRNCLVNYIAKCMKGKYHVFRVTGPERATAGFSLGRHRWYCAELKGFRNASVTKETKKCIARLEWEINHRCKVAMDNNENIL